MACISPAGYVRRWDWFSEMAEMDSGDFTIYPLVNHGKTMGKPWGNHGKMAIYSEFSH